MGREKCHRFCSQMTSCYLQTVQKTYIQCLFNRLAEYSLQWGMVVNTDKTVAMIFNRKGEYIDRSFMYNGAPVRTVKSAVYLGIVFVPSGVFTEPQTQMAQKANRALSAIKRALLRDKDCALQPKTALRVFDIYVKPILLYGCQIWGPSSLRKMSVNNGDPHVSNLSDLNVTEAIHTTQFCKYILGVYENTSNVAVRCELGRIPMEYDIKLAIAKYWHRLTLLPEEHILNQALRENIALDDRRKNVWVTCAKSILQKNGLGFMCVNRGLDFNLCKLKSVLYDQHQQRVHEELFNDNVKVGTGSKLRTFRNYANAPNKMENYLNDVNKFKNRKPFSKLRLSSHQLAIETGRHTNTPVNERRCAFCPENIEHEIHFVSECKLYDTLRKTLYHNISKEIHSFEEYSPENKLKILMQPHGKVAVLVTHFVREAFLTRKAYN